MSKITSLNISVVHTEGVPVELVMKTAVAAIRALGTQVVPPDQANKSADLLVGNDDYTILWPATDIKRNVERKAAPVPRASRARAESP